MTPLSCSLVVRALVGPALGNDPFLAPLQYEHLWVLRLFTTPPFLLSAGIAILVLVTTHGTKPTWYSSLGASPIGALLIRSRCFSEDAILCFFSVATSCTSPLRMVLGVHVLSRVFLLFFVY